MLNNNKKLWVHAILSSITFLSISLLIIGFFKKEEILTVSTPRLPKTRNLASEPQIQIPSSEHVKEAPIEQKLDAVPAEISFLISPEQIAKIRETLSSEKMAEELIEYAIGKKLETENVVDIKVEGGFEIKTLGDGWKTHRLIDSQHEAPCERYYKNNASFFRCFSKEKTLESASWLESGETYGIDLDSEGHIVGLQYTSEDLKITIRQHYDAVTNTYKGSYQSLIDGSRVFF